MVTGYRRAVNQAARSCAHLRYSADRRGAVAEGTVLERLAELALPPLAVLARMRVSEGVAAYAVVTPSITLMRRKASKRSSISSRVRLAARSQPNSSTQRDATAEP